MKLCNDIGVYLHVQGKTIKDAIELTMQEEITTRENLVLYEKYVATCSYSYANV